jgi:hypothetical protein
VATGGASDNDSNCPPVESTKHPGDGGHELMGGVVLGRGNAVQAAVSAAACPCVSLCLESSSPSVSLYLDLIISASFASY